MSESIWLQSIINGLMAGWIYILFAIGLSLLLSISGIIQLAHGEVYMLGGYATYYFFIVFGLNFFLSLVLSIIVIGFFGVALEKIFFRPFRGKFTTALVIGLALTVGLQTSAAVSFGSRTRTLTSTSLLTGYIEILGARIPETRLVVILISIALTTILLLFVYRTKIGQSMVAMSQDPTAATLQGINIDRVSSISMFLGSGLAAAGGSLMGFLFTIDPGMGGPALLKGIAVMIIGGLGSLPGAVIGGLILGLIDGIIPTIWSTQVASIIGFLAMIVILVIKPEGLMGHES